MFARILVILIASSLVAIFTGQAFAADGDVCWVSGRQGTVRNGQCEVPAQGGK